jgi:hypothetical protein
VVRRPADEIGPAADTVNMDDDNVELLPLI